MADPFSFENITGRDTVNLTCKWSGADMSDDLYIRMRRCLLALYDVAEINQVSLDKLDTTYNMQVKLVDGRKSTYVIVGDMFSITTQGDKFKREVLLKIGDLRECLMALAGRWGMTHFEATPNQ